MIVTMRIRVPDTSRSLLGLAAGAVSTAAAVARHVAWYVGYRVDGRARKRPRD
jgi:hypothetical protein